MKRVNKIIKIVFSHKLISLVLIPVVLLIFYFSASLILNNQISFSVLTHAQNNKDVKQIPSGKLLKGNKISGEFIANENYLGLVMLRFENYVKPDYSNEDILRFSIKEKGSRSWYYANDYRSGSFEHQKYYPFGFTPIINSKNKIYQFELLSKNGNQTNALVLDKSTSKLLTGYKIPKNEIFSSKARLISFLFAKAVYSFTNIDFLLSSTIYLVPFSAYIFLLLIFGKSSFLKELLGFTVVFIILTDIFLIKDLYNGILIILLLGWITTVIIHKLESSVTFAFSFLLLFVWIIIVAFGMHYTQNKLNVWVYFFLLTGLLQALIEEKINIKNLVGYKQILRRISKFK